MKKNLLILAALLCAGFWIASCKEDKGSGGQPITQSIPPSCQIIMFAGAGGALSGDVQMIFALTAQNNRPVDLEVFYNTGSGSHDATEAQTSSIPNPAHSLATPGTYSFTWSSVTDIPGAAPNTTIIAKTTDKGSGLFGLCSAKFSVDNTPVVIDQAPTCLITAPAGGSTKSGDVTVTYNTADAEGDPVITTIEYSTITQYKLTASAPTYSNPTPATTPGSGRTYIWRSAVDEASYRGAVALRITVNDGSKQSTCSTNFTLDNSAITTPFTCNITSPTQGTTVGGTVPINFNMVGAVTGIIEILEFSNGVTRRMVDGPRPITQSSPGSATLQWNSLASGIGATAPTTGIIYLNLLGTGSTGTTCSVGQITVDNTTPPPTPIAPTCSITSPTSSSPAQSGNIVLTYNATDPNAGDIISTRVEYERTSGSFALVTLSGANPITGVTPGSGKTATWQSTIEFPPPSGPTTVSIRMRVADQTGLNNTCTTSFTVTNPGGTPVNHPPTCNIVGPPAGGTYSGPITIGYDTLDPDADPLTATFDFNPGSAYRAATPKAPYTRPRSLPAPTAGLDYLWDSVVDLPAQTAGVTFKVTVDDGQATVNCTRGFTVDNQTPPPPPPPPAVSFSNDVYPIFAARGCSASCHSAASAFGGLNLSGTPAQVYPRIVPSRVNIGNPPASLIYAKPTGGVSHMPGIVIPVGSPDAQKILDWIIDGAPNN